MATRSASGCWETSAGLGDGVDKDLPAARQWYLRSADQGFVPAEVRLGLMSEHGNGAPQDYADALRWFRLAADAGNAEALNAVGTFYRHGLAVPQDYAQAMRLFRQAADKGFPMADFNIGLLYADGEGVKVDKVQARAWFQKAAAGATNRRSPGWRGLTVSAAPWVVRVGCRSHRASMQDDRRVRIRAYADLGINTYLEPILITGRFG